MTENYRKISVPSMVEAKAKAAGEVGIHWLESLPHIVSELEQQLGIIVGEAIQGGTHAFVAHAARQNGEEYILKIEIPDLSEEEFLSSIKALIIADGRGYPKTYYYSTKLRAYLMERLGDRLKDAGFTQIRKPPLKRGLISLVK